MVEPFGRLDSWTVLGLSIVQPRSDGKSKADTEISPLFSRFLLSVVA